MHAPTRLTHAFAAPTAHTPKNDQLVVTDCLPGDTHELSPFFFCVESYEQKIKDRTDADKAALTCSRPTEWPRSPGRHWRTPL